MCTKFGIWIDHEANKRGIRNDPEYVHLCCEKSLKRLGVDQIDLYYCHRVDKNAPIEIVVGEMKKLQDAGKVKHLGLSEVSADTIRRACKVRLQESNSRCTQANG